MSKSLDILPEQYLLHRKMIRASFLWGGGLLLFVWIMFLAVHVFALRADKQDRDPAMLAQRQEAGKVLVVRDELEKVLKQLQDKQTLEKEQVVRLEQLHAYWKEPQWDGFLQDVVQAAPEDVWVLNLEALPQPLGDSQALVQSVQVTISGKARSAALARTFFERLSASAFLTSVELKPLTKAAQIDGETWTVFEVVGQMK